MRSVRQLASGKGEQPPFNGSTPGFGCPATATVNLATIPNARAQQATGAGSAATTCAVVNGEGRGHCSCLGRARADSWPDLLHAGLHTDWIQLDHVHRTARDNRNDARWYNRRNFLPDVSHDRGRHGVLSGTGGSISPPAISPTGPWTGITGVTLKSGQHVCGWLVENGDDTAFPGSQSLEIVDDKGNTVPGSPALVPLPQQGHGQPKSRLYGHGSAEPIHACAQ